MSPARTANQSVSYRENNPQWKQGVWATKSKRDGCGGAPHAGGCAKEK